MIIKLNGLITTHNLIFSNRYTPDGHCTGEITDQVPNPIRLEWDMPEAVRIHLNTDCHVTRVLGIFENRLLEKSRQLHLCRVISLRLHHAVENTSRQLMLSVKA